MNWLVRLLQMSSSSAAAPVASAAAVGTFGSLFEQSGGEATLKIGQLDKADWAPDDKSDPFSPFVLTITNEMLHVPPVKGFDPSKTSLNQGIESARKAAIATITRVRSRYVTFAKRYGAAAARKALLTALQLYHKFDDHKFKGHVLGEAETHLGITYTTARTLDNGQVARSLAFVVPPNLRQNLKVAQSAAQTAAQPDSPPTEQTVSPTFSPAATQPALPPTEQPASAPPMTQSAAQSAPVVAENPIKLANLPPVELQLLQAIMRDARTPIQENDFKRFRAERFRRAFPTAQSLVGKSTESVQDTINQQLDQSLIKAKKLLCEQKQLSESDIVEMEKALDNLFQPFVTLDDVQTVRETLYRKRRRGSYSSSAAAAAAPPALTKRPHHAGDRPTLRGSDVLTAAQDHPSLLLLCQLASEPDPPAAPAAPSGAAPATTASSSASSSSAAAAAATVAAAAGAVVPTARERLAEELGLPELKIAEPELFKIIQSQLHAQLLELEQKTATVRKVEQSRTILKRASDALQTRIQALDHQLENLHRSHPWTSSVSML